MNFYRRYIGDYARDTTSLSLAEHGAYALLLDCYYADGLPLESDLGALYRICRATTKTERNAVASVADRFFPVNGDGRRHNDRADRELEKAKPAIEAAKKNGSRHANGGSTGVPSGGASGLPGLVTPTTNHQPPLAFRQPPASDPPPKESTSLASASRSAQREEKAAKTRPTRQAYAEAYRLRYSVDPTWDKQANSMIVQFVDKVGVEDAPSIAAFFLTHCRQDYLRSKHDVALMLRDARGLRTEWATGRKVTETAARQGDRTAALGYAFAGVIAEAEKEAKK